MFDLDQQIDRWKSAFAKQAACSSDELLELESHLREEIAALVAIGRSEQKPFAKVSHASETPLRSAANSPRTRIDSCGTAWPCAATA